jgi:lipopolysaccharide export system permease protein
LVILAEHNELTALKASGLSLIQNHATIIYGSSIICLGTFYFANYIIPVANLKWRALIYDIQETKISKIITPGSYSTELEGYAIKVNEGEDGKFKDIVIHDHNDPNIVKTVKAKSAATLYNAISWYFPVSTSNRMVQVLEELGVNQSMII